MAKLSKEHQKQVKAMEKLLKDKPDSTLMDGGMYIKRGKNNILKKVKTVKEARTLINKIKDGKVILA